MKHLPLAFLVSVLALALHAEAPPAKPTPSAESQPSPNPNGDPFVKDNGSGDGNGGDNETWKVCHLILETYALDKTDAQAVLDTERGGAARYRRVLELAKAGKARLETLTGLAVKSGQRSIVESIDEVTYPTEFAPPSNPKGTLAPTAWETRNVGDTLEVEPVIQADGRTCDLNLVPQRVSFVGFRDGPKAEDRLSVSQPIFDTQKITTAVSTQDGQPQFLGTMSRTTSQGAANGGGASEVCLAFIHVSLLDVPAGADKAPAKKDASAVVDLVYSFYSVDRAAARDLLVAPASMQAPWDKLQALVAEKKARLEHVSTVETKSGQRAVTEEIREERYMTENCPPGVISKTDGTRRTTTSEVSGKPGASGKTTTTETTTVTHATPDDPQLPGYPTASEVRNTGVTVEVEPVVGPDGKTIDLNEAVKSVKYPGNLQATGLAAHYPARPLFEDANITTGQTLPAGMHVFVSTMNPPGADGVNDRPDTGRTWLLFVRANVGEP